jgi:hypothetical protein
MAIVQSRIIQLIDAGMDYQKALRTIINHIHSQFNHLNAPNSTASAPDMIAYLANLADEQFLLSDPTQSPNILASEHHHFALNIHRNTRKAQIAAAKRRDTLATQRRTYDPNQKLSTLLAEPPAKRLAPSQLFWDPDKSDTPTPAQRAYMDAHLSSPEYKAELATWEEEEQKRILAEADEEDAKANAAFAQLGQSLKESESDK